MNQFLRINFFKAQVLFWISGLILILSTDKLQLHKFLNGFNSHFLDLITPFATHIGDGLFAITLAIGYYFVDKKNSILITLSFLISAGITQFLKQVIFSDAMRPMHYFLHDDSVHIVRGVTLHTQNSFPSGHATTCFAIFSIIALIYSHNKRIQLPLFFCALFFALTRVYLSQHFFEDVYVGSIVGTLTTCIVWMFRNSFFASKKQ
jgi:membrane-associated phospholipid phosphatase